MGLSNIVTLLPCIAVSLARAQTSDAIESNASISAPIYTPEQCDSWVDFLLSSDEDSSNGLSEKEYHSFLSSIVDPPYISEYFGRYDSFDQLPWVFRVMQKSLACHCEMLGLGGKCCEGDNAEVLLLGLNSSPNLRNSAGDEYKDLFCQQIAYVLTKAISSPVPTARPSARPTESPSARPSARPTESPSVQEVTPEVKARSEGGDQIEEGNGLSTGAIVAIVIGVIAVIIVAIALVAIHRQKEEESRVREFAGDEAPESDLEVPVPVPVVTAPAEEKEDDDDSAAPSVWSGDEADDAGVELHEDQEDRGATAGSALAAMGAASTVTARISAGDGVV